MKSLQKIEVEPLTLPTVRIENRFTRPLILLQYENIVRNKSNFWIVLSDSVLIFRCSSVIALVSNLLLCFLIHYQNLDKSS